MFHMFQEKNIEYLYRFKMAAKYKQIFISRYFDFGEKFFKKIIFQKEFF